MLYLGIATSSFPASQASCELVFPLVVLTPKSLEFSLRLSPRFVLGRAKPIVTPCSVLSAKSNLELRHNRIPQTTTWFLLYNVKIPTQNENIHKVNSVLHLPTTINISCSLLLCLEALNSPSCPHLLHKTVPIH